MAATPRTAILATLLGDLAMAIAKLVAAILTGSAALLAEAIHSAGSTGNQGLLLLNIRLGRIPTSDSAGLALARERYFWGAIVVFAVFGVGGAFAVYTGCVVLLADTPVGDHAVVAYGVLGIAAVFSLFSTHGSLRQYLLSARGRTIRETFVEAKDPTVVLTVVEDLAGILGVVVVLAGLLSAQAFGRAAFDGAAAVVVGLLLALRAILAALKAKRMLLGHAAASSDLDKVRRILALQPGVEKVHDITAVHLAPHNVLLGLALDFRFDVGSDEARRIVYSIEYRIREALPHMRQIYIEAKSVVRLCERVAERKVGDG